MDNQNNNIENKKNIKGLIIIIILLIVVLSVCGYICYNSFFNNKEPNNNENYGFNERDDGIDTDSDDTDMVTDDTYEFDFDAMSSELHSLIQKEEISTFIEKCEDKITGENGPPETEQTNIDVSADTIDIVINKLKTAKSIDENITSSWFGCPPRNITYYVGINTTDMSYRVGRITFSLNYAGSSDILLVSYNNVGYAFYFNDSEEIDNFIESLE